MGWAGFFDRITFDLTIEFQSSKVFYVDSQFWTNWSHPGMQNSSSTLPVQIIWWIGYSPDWYRGCCGLLWPAIVRANVSEQQWINFFFIQLLSIRLWALTDLSQVFGADLYCLLGKDRTTTEAVSFLDSRFRSRWTGVSENPDEDHNRSTIVQEWRSEKLRKETATTQNKLFDEVSSKLSNTRCCSNLKSDFGLFRLKICMIVGMKAILAV